MIEYRGKSVFEGIAIGVIHIVNQSNTIISKALVEDVAKERINFEDSIQKAQKELENLSNGADQTQKEILDVHILMLNDPDFLEICSSYLDLGHTASYAVFMAGNELATMLKQIDDEYMNQRASDVLDISSRIIRILKGEVNPLDIKDNTILFAEDITPSELIGYDKSKLKGIVTTKGSLSSHVAIIARGLSLPFIVDTSTNIDSSYEGKHAIIDGFNGVVILEPSSDVHAVYDNRFRQLDEEKIKRRTLIGQDNITLDGKRINVYANIGKSQDAKIAIHEDCGGIGLFRSEFLYLESKDYPTEEFQMNEYKKVLEQMDGKPVIIRTMDIGADKQADYFNLPKEDNPALGLRSLRICFERPHIMKTQLRALYRASVYGNLKIMVPMIICKEEVLWVKAMASEVMEELTAEGIPFDSRVEIGIMIETPAAAMISDELAEVSDFFSIGTNDLTQYTLAIDRQNQRLEHLFDSKHKAILRLIELACRNAHQKGIWCGVCGELARNLELTEFFLGIGIDELSVSASYILKLREKIQSVDTRTIDIHRFIG